MLHRNRPPVISALAIWLILAVVLASSIPTAEARRRNRRRRKKAQKATPEVVAKRSTQVGSPKVLVVRRQNVRAFRLASLAFRKDLALPSGEVILDPSTPATEQLEDILDAKPKVILALGPGAASVLSRGGAGVPVVYGYVTQRPVTTVRQGGWLAPATSSRRVLVWLGRLVSRLRRVAVVVRDPKGSLAQDFRAACRHRGVQPVVIVAGSAADVTRRVVAALKQRPDALWLGQHVELYPLGVLRQLRRIQALFRLPMVGLSPEHVKQGLVLALDASPAQVALAARRLIQRRLAAWLLPSARGPRREKRAPQASQLFREEAQADRISLGSRTAKALGLDPQAALKAGAQKVGP